MASEYNPEEKIHGPNASFYDAVTLRRVHKAKSFAKLGSLPTVTTTQKPVWTGAGEVILLTNAEALNIVSTSVADTAAGTGARTLIILGLDAAGLEISEVISMNGTTNVLTTNAFFRVNELVTLTAGSGDVNAGEISAISSVSSIEVAHVATGDNRARQSHFTVPSDKYAIVRWIMASSSKNSVVEFEIFEQLSGRARVPVSTLTLSDATQEINIPLGAFFSPLNTIFVRCKTVSGTGSASVNYVGYLVDKEQFDLTN